MSGKPKVAFYWCASCGGCEETVVDLHEKILDVVAAVDIVFWPCAMDFKRQDVEAMADGELTVAFINGAVRTSEQAHMARLLRAKAQIVIAFGSCATHGGIPALANLTSRRRIFETSFHRSPTVVNPGQCEPVTQSVLDGQLLELPDFHQTVSRLSDVIEVDYLLPGCPPTSASLADAVGVLLSGELPPRGSVLLPDKNLCSTCSRNESKPERLTIDAIRRVVDVQLDPERCFLEQGVICMGPATRAGCDCPCIEGNMPCTGCNGPTDAAHDQGARMVAALGGLLAGDETRTVEQTQERLNDPAGTFYRYGMAASLLGSDRPEEA